MQKRPDPLPDEIMQAAEEATEIFQRQADEATAAMLELIHDLEEGAP